MTPLNTPPLTGDAKANYVKRALYAVEAAGVLRDALHALSEEAGTAAIDERIDTVEQLQNELLEHAMRVTLG